MDYHQYIIDVRKLGVGDVWEMLAKLNDFASRAAPCKLALDYLEENIHFAFWGDALDKQAVDDLLSRYIYVSFTHDGEDY